MNKEFSEVISSYLVKLMDKVKNDHGENSSEYKALFYQYVKSNEECRIMQESNIKHYEARVCVTDGRRLIERLYKRQVTIDLISACSAHCRYCLRQNYDTITMSEKDENEIIEYLKNDIYIKEVLITGGDPLLASNILIRIATRIINEAPNIRVIRIGTRLPVQNPLIMDKKLLEFFSINRNKVYFEIALQVNHVVELQNEARGCIKELQERGVRIYSQNVLLRNVNDSMNDLISLYDELRYMHIESHYLFHPVPLARTAQFRMPLVEFLDFAKNLTASGEIPGRSKPMFSIMTDIGKCTLYEGTLLDKDEDGYYDIKTSYILEERKKWNRGYNLPKSARIGEDGKLIVKYLDGKN